MGGKFDCCPVSFCTVPFFFSNQVLQSQLESLGLNTKPIVERFLESYKAMWALNGHSLSRIFTGSRALEGKAKVKEKSEPQLFCDISITMKLNYYSYFYVGWEIQRWCPVSITDHSVKLF